MQRAARTLSRIPLAGWLAICLTTWILALYLGGGKYLLRFGATQTVDLLGAAGLLAGLYLLPGAALLLLLWPRLLVQGQRLEFILLSLCAGAAVPPLLLEVFDLPGLRFGRAALWGFLAICLLVVGLRGYRLYRSAGMQPAGAGGLTAPARVWTGFLLAGLFLILLAGRLAAVSGLPTAMWGDSYQHTMITQLLADNGGLFTSWLPYAPLNTFSYHFGFHANAVFLHWLTGLPVPQAVLLTGQLLNWLAVAGCFLFAARLTGSRAAGLAAAVLVGLINPMPAFYFNWGRYTQLAGMVILPAALLAWDRLLEGKRFDWRAAGLAGVLTAGLACTHYIITIFLVAGVAALVLTSAVRSPGWPHIWRLNRYSAAAGLLGIVLAGPWLANTMGGFLVRNAAGFISGSVGDGRIRQAVALEPLVPQFFHGLVLAAGALGLLAGAARRQWRVVFLIFWIGLMFLAALPRLFGLPGSGVVDLFTVYLALFLPVSALAGFLISAAQAALDRPGWASAVRTAGTLLLIGGSVWGAAIQHTIRDETSQIFTAADEAGMAWIRENTAPDSRFFVNGNPAYGGTLVAGTDGGWWIPLLTGRESTLPPLTYGSERGIDPEFSRRVNGLYADLRGQPLTDTAPRLIDLSRPGAFKRLVNEGVDYIYLGAKASPGPFSADWIDLAGLRAHPDLFRLVYDQAGVQIYAVETAPR